MHSARDNDPPRAPTPPNFPSIFDLARLAGDINRRSTMYDTARGCTPAAAATGSGLCLDLMGHLHGIIGSRRAESLPDAAAQMVTGFLLVDLFDATEKSEEETARYVTMMRRIFLSSIPIVAAAAGVDLGEFDAAYIPDFANREFPPATLA